jgi:PAS domain-containing protein
VQPGSSHGRPCGARDAGSFPRSGVPNLTSLPLALAMGRLHDVDPSRGDPPAREASRPAGKAHPSGRSSRTLERRSSSHRLLRAGRGTRRRTRRRNHYAAVVAGGQRNLVLILARDFASRLATAVFLVDATGDVIYFNEAAERVLGSPYEEGRTMPAAEWSTAFEPVDEEGQRLRLEDLPLGVAVTRREPAHRELRMRGADGVPREIEVTAFPLFAHADEFVGAVAIFWEPSEAR